MKRTNLSIAAMLVLSCAAGALAQSPLPSEAAPAAQSRPTPPEASAAANRTAASAEQAHTAATDQPAPQAKATDSSLRAGAARSGKATDQLQLGTTEISGNRELPKVLYVVPWRRPEIGDAVGRPPNSLVEEALTPVDRAVFRRQNRYYAALEAGAALGKSQPAAAGAAAPRAAPKDER